MDGQYRWHLTRGVPVHAADGGLLHWLGTATDIEDEKREQEAVRKRVARARSFQPEVVLCDIGLPGMDGDDVARALRADAQLRQTRLIALSGYALPQDLQRAHEAGFEGHLAKPPRMEAIENLLANQGAPTSQPGSVHGHASLGCLQQTADKGPDVPRGGRRHHVAT